MGDSVLVLADVDGRSRRGWLQLGDLQQGTTAKSRPGQILRDVAFDALNKIDVSVDLQSGDVNVSLTTESDEGDTRRH